MDLDQKRNTHICYYTMHVKLKIGNYVQKIVR
jgi:hypothetical protein